MARPYRDGAELATEPVPERRSPLVPADAVIVVGVWYPGIPQPAPIALLPGYEYRIRRFVRGRPHGAGPASDVTPEDNEPGWTIERRTVGPPGDDD